MIKLKNTTILSASRKLSSGNIKINGKFQKSMKEMARKNCILITEDE